MKQTIKTKLKRFNTETLVEYVTRFYDNYIKNVSGQDIAEYAVMLAVIIVIVIGTVKLVGGNANNIFSKVASALQ